MSLITNPPSADTRPADTRPAATSSVEPPGAQSGVAVDAQLPEVLEIVPWSHPTFELAGHDPRSEYVERFWLGLLGPSTTWLLRRFARGLDECPTGFRIDLPETGRALGLGESMARSSTTHRSVVRACQFGAAYRVSERRLAVRSHLPMLSRRQLGRLPEKLQVAHDAWVDGEVAADELRRASAAAYGLRTIGETLGGVERQLRAWGYRTDDAREACRVAFDL